MDKYHSNRSAWQLAGHIPAYVVASGVTDLFLSLFSMIGFEYLGRAAKPINRFKAKTRKNTTFMRPSSTLHGSNLAWPRLFPLYGCLAYIAYYIPFKVHSFLLDIPGAAVTVKCKRMFNVRSNAWQ